MQLEWFIATITILYAELNKYIDENRYGERNVESI